MSKGVPPSTEGHLRQTWTDCILNMKKQLAKSLQHKTSPFRGLYQSVPAAVRIALLCLIHPPHPPLIDHWPGEAALYLHGFLGTEPSLSERRWTMWKTPISTADKSSRAPGVKPGSLDIPLCLMAPNELNGVCVTSGRYGGCWYQIEVATSDFPCTFTTFSSGYVAFDLAPMQRTIMMESVWFTRLISGGILITVNIDLWTKAFLFLFLFSMALK